MTTTADPVCGMAVERFEAYAAVRFEGKTFYFCSDLCKARFDADPERYAYAEGLRDMHP